MKRKFGKVCLHKLHLKCIQNVYIAVINDNNNFAPSLFRSLCEFVGDCFGPPYFSLGAALPQKNTSVENNHLRYHTMTSKKMVRIYFCLNNFSLHHPCTSRRSILQTTDICDFFLLRCLRIQWLPSCLKSFLNWNTPYLISIELKCYSVLWMFLY